MRTVMLKVHMGDGMRSNPVATDPVLRADLELVNRIWKQACLEGRFVEKADGRIDINYLDPALDTFSDGTAGMAINMAAFAQQENRLPSSGDTISISRFT